MPAAGIADRNGHAAMSNESEWDDRMGELHYDLLVEQAGKIAELERQLVLLTHAAERVATAFDDWDAGELILSYLHSAVDDLRDALDGAAEAGGEE